MKKSSYNSSIARVLLQCLVGGIAMLGLGMAATYAIPVLATSFGNDVDVTGDLTVAGNAGIGTKHPKATLEILGALGPPGNPAPGHPVLRLKTVSYNNSSPDAITFENDVASRQGFQQFGIVTAYDGTFRINRIYPDRYDFVITKDGNVGIGTVAPLSQLDINESTAANVSAALIGRGGNSLNADIFFGVKNSGGADAGASIGSDGALGGGLSLVGDTGGSGNPDVYISTVGNLGIGTTNPTGKLDVNDNRIRIESPRTPVSSSETCNQGEIAWDANYIYTCVAANTWKRAALAMW